MKGYTPNPTIRILMLGAEGVGKNCIESRVCLLTIASSIHLTWQFTTKVYPPPYNPALTLNSRRFFTLAPIHDGHDGHPDTEHTDKAKQAAAKTASVSMNEQPPATSSAASSASSAQSTPSLDLDDRPLVDADAACGECVREHNTYLVEVINYPALHSSARVRAQVHSKADYDAVLLVYDVCARASFDAVTALHAEIPVCTRKNHHYHHRRAAHHASTTRSRTTGWFGGGGSDVTGHTGSGEIVVGLIGNKSDVDVEGQTHEEEEPKTGRVATTSIDNEARAHDSLSGPLYHASIMYEELMASRARVQLDKAEPPSAPDVAVPIPAQSEREGGDAKHALAEALKKEDIQKWLQISRLEPQPGPTHERPCPAGDASPASPSTPLQRQVLPSDGDALARQLNLAVPFRETSAKTGAHVALVFEDVVRAVLREMGRDASGTNKAGKTCRHKANLVKVKSAASGTSPTSVGPGASLLRGREEEQPPGVSKSTVISVTTAGLEDCEDRPEVAAMSGEAVHIVGAETAGSGGSKMGRVRMFLRKAV